MGLVVKMCLAIDHPPLICTGTVKLPEQKDMDNKVRQADGGKQMRDKGIERRGLGEWSKHNELWVGVDQRRITRLDSAHRKRKPNTESLCSVNCTGPQETKRETEVHAHSFIHGTVKKP